MINQHPKGEAMARAGKGTAAATDAGNSQPLTWERASEQLTRTQWFWLATVRPDGRPHVMPVLMAWSDPTLFVASRDTARKSRNLDANGHCVVTADTGEIHLIIEGEADRVTDDATLRLAADVFKRIHGWETWVVDDKLDADYGAPTSGGPPYNVYAIRPTKAFALPIDGETTTPTRWRF
jgi:hypothetical protein